MPKTRYTLLVEFDGDPPSVAANQPILGGKLVEVSFRDEMAALRHLEDVFQKTASGLVAGNDVLRDALRDIATTQTGLVGEIASDALRAEREARGV